MIGPGEPAREGEPPPRAGSSRPGRGDRQRGCAPREDLGDVGEHLAPAVVGLAPFQEVVRIGFRLRVGQGSDPGKQDLFGLELGDLVPPARRLLLVFGERGQDLFILGLEMAAELLVEVFLDRAPFWLRELEGDLDVAPDRLGELVELLLVETGFERLGERLDLGLDGGDLAIDRIVRGLRGIALGLVAEFEQPLLRNPPVERGVRRGENGGDRVVVFVADRVVLVAVAAGAAERETEQGRVNDLDRVGEDLGTVGGEVVDRAIGRVHAGAQEARRDQVIGQGRRELFGVQEILKLIAGELFEQEPIVRLIGVEGADDVVAVVVELTPDRIEAIAPVGLGIACRVQPVLSPCSPYRGESRSRPTSRS